MGDEYNQSMLHTWMKMKPIILYNHYSKNIHKPNMVEHWWWPEFLETPMVNPTLSVAETRKINTKSKFNSQNAGNHSTTTEPLRI